jgi:hypothetical protein
VRATTPSWSRLVPLALSFLFNQFLDFRVERSRYHFHHNEKWDVLQCASATESIHYNLQITSLTSNQIVLMENLLNICRYPRPKTFLRT